MPADSSLLNFFSGLAIAGAVIVTLGVILEGAEYFVKWGKKKKFRKWIGDVFEKSRRQRIVVLVKWLEPKILPVETLGFAILIFGLAIELLGSFSAERLQSKENRTLELQSNLVQSNNFALSIELQKLKNPRTISPEQWNKFLELSKGLPHLKVRVFSPSSDNEAYRYAFQVRKMLDEAGFGANGEGVNEVFGFVRERPDSKESFNNFDISGFWYSTNENAQLFTYSMNTTPKFVDGKRILVVTNPEAIFPVVMWNFNQINIRASDGPNATLLKPDEFGIFVPPKIH